MTLMMYSRQNSAQKSLTPEEKEKLAQERRLRAIFLQEMLVSTLVPFSEA
jgi:hypothetical protein